jgi:hypothetical protein
LERDKFQSCKSVIIIQTHSIHPVQCQFLNLVSIHASNLFIMKLRKLYYESNSQTYKFGSITTPVIHDIRSEQQQIYPSAPTCWTSKTICTEIWKHESRRTSPKLIPVLARPSEHQIGRRFPERIRRRRRRQEHDAPGRGHPPPERVPPHAAHTPRGPRQEVRHGVLALLRLRRRWGRRGGREREARRRRRPEGAGDDPGVPEPRERAGAEEAVVVRSTVGVEEGG